MPCKTSSGVINTCASRTKGSGLGKGFWLGYKSELDTQISLAQIADISTLDFGSYGGLRYFEGSKFSHDFTWEEVLGGGNTISYNQAFNWRLNPDSTADDLTIQNMNEGDDIFIITEDLNQKFFILGAGNGLTSSAANGGSGGKEQGGDASVLGTLAGNESTMPLRFSRGDGYEGTRAYLVSRQL